MTVARTVQRVVNPNAAKAIKLLDDARDVAKRVPALAAGARPPAGYLDAVAGANMDLSDIADKLAALGNGKKIHAAIAEVSQLRSACESAARAALGVRS